MPEKPNTATIAVVGIDIVARLTGPVISGCVAVLRRSSAHAAVCTVDLAQSADRGGGFRLTWAGNPTRVAIGSIR